MNSAVVKAAAGAVVTHKDLNSYDLVEVRSNPTRFPRVCNTNPRKAHHLMKELVIDTLMLKGLSLDDNAADFIAANLIAALMRDDQHLGLRDISWYEAGRAIRKAALAGELYGVSVATLFACFVEYAKGEGHDAYKLAATSRGRQLCDEDRQRMEALIDKASESFARRARV